MRRRRLTLVTMLAVVLLCVWFFFMRRNGDSGTAQLRLSGYHPAPKNAVLAWAGRLGRKLDGASLNSQMFQLGGHGLSWSYSNPTSGWYQFGATIQGSNQCYWSFALPHAVTWEGAAAELPNLTFRSPLASSWEGLLSTNNVDFREHVSGHGAIRLPVGQPILVRHVADSNVAFLVQCEAIQVAYNGDVKVRFRHKTLGHVLAEHGVR